MAALSIDRYCAISNPLHYLRFVYAKRTIAFIIFAWILSLTLNVIIPITLDQFTSLSAVTFTRLDNNNNISRHSVHTQQSLADLQRLVNEPPIVLNPILTSNTTNNNNKQHSSRNLVIPLLKTINAIDLSDNKKINSKTSPTNNESVRETSADSGSEYDVECFDGYDHHGKLHPSIFDESSPQQSTFQSMATLWSPSKSAIQWLWIDHKLAQTNNNKLYHQGPKTRNLITSKCNYSNAANSLKPTYMGYTNHNSTANIRLSAKEESLSKEILNESHEHQLHLLMIKLTLYSTTCLILVIIVPLIIIILCNIHIYYIAKNHKSRMLTNSSASNKQTPTPSFSGNNHTPSHHYDLEANRELSLASRLAKKRQLLTRLSSSQSLTTTTAPVPTINERVGHHQVIVPSNNNNQFNILLSNDSFLSKQSRLPVMRASSLQDDSLIPVDRRISLANETNHDQMHQQDHYQQLYQDYTDFTTQRQQHCDINSTKTETKPDEKSMLFIGASEKSDNNAEQQQTQREMPRLNDTSLDSANNDASNKRCHTSRQSSSSSIQLPNCIDQNGHKCCRRTNSRASLISAVHSIKMGNCSRQQSIVSFSDNLPTYISDNHIENHDSTSDDASGKPVEPSQLHEKDKLGNDRMRSRCAQSRQERNCSTFLVNHQSHQINYNNNYVCHHHSSKNYYNDVDSIAHNLKLAGMTLAGIRSDKCLRENHHQNRVHQYHGHCQVRASPNHLNCICSCYDCTIYSFHNYSHASNSSLNCYPLLLGGMTAGVIAAPQGSSCGFSQVATSVGVRKHDAFSAVIYLILGLLLFGLPHYILVTYTIIKSPSHYVFSNIDQVSHKQGSYFSIAKENVGKSKDPLSKRPDAEKWLAILSIACRLLFIAMIPVNAWLYGIRSRSLRSTMRRVLHRYISRRQASIEISKRRKSTPSIRSRDSSFKKGNLCINGSGHFWITSSTQTSSQNIPTLIGQVEACDCRRANSCCASIMDGATSCLVNTSQNQFDCSMICLTKAEHRTHKTNHEKSCAKRRRNGSPLNPFTVLHSLAMKLVNPGAIGTKGSKSNSLSSNQHCRKNDDVSCSDQVECAHKQSATSSSMANTMKNRDSNCCQPTNKQISNQQPEEDCSYGLSHPARTVPNTLPSQHLPGNTESSAGSVSESNREDDQMLTLLLKKTRTGKAARLQRCLAINQSDSMSSKFKKAVSDDRWTASDTSDSSRRVSSASTLESSLVLSTTSTRCQCICAGHHMHDCHMISHQKFQQLPLSEQTSNSTTATTVYQQSQPTAVLGRKYSTCNCQSVSRRCSTVHNPQLSIDSPHRACEENDIHFEFKQRTSIDSEYALYNENLVDTDLESQFTPDNSSNRSSDTQNVLAKIGFGFGLGFGLGFGHNSSSNCKSDKKEIKRSRRIRHSIPSTDNESQVEEQERLALLSSTKKQLGENSQEVTTTSKLELDPHAPFPRESSILSQRRRHSHSHCDSSMVNRNSGIHPETINTTKLDHDDGEQDHDNREIEITSFNHDIGSKNEFAQDKKNPASDERSIEAVEDIKKMLVTAIDRSKQCGYSTTIIENNSSNLRTNHHVCNSSIYPPHNHHDGENTNNLCRTNHIRTTVNTRYPNFNIDLNSSNIKDTMNENYSTFKLMTTDCKCTRDHQCSNKNSSIQDEKMKAVTQNNIIVTTMPNKCDTVVSYENNDAIYTSLSPRVRAECRKSDLELPSPTKVTVDTKKSNIPPANLKLTHCLPIEINESSGDHPRNQLESASIKTIQQSAGQNNIVGKQTISSCVLGPKLLTREADRTTNLSKGRSRSVVGPFSGHNALNLEQRTLTGYGMTKTSFSSLLNAINIMTSQSIKEDKSKASNDSIKDKEIVCSHGEGKSKDPQVECRNSNHRLIPPTSIQLSGARQIITNTLLSPIREGSTNHSCASSQTSLNNSSSHNLNQHYPGS